MVPPRGAFVLVLDGGRVVAGGGVRALEDGVAEIKRMFVVPEARGAGHGRRLLDALETAAAELGYRALRLDTAQSMKTAMEMYRRSGYRDIPDYNGNSYASFWGEKDLRQRAV
jgi:GNAT superfamily N-acetyltransferase